MPSAAPRPFLVEAPIPVAIDHASAPFEKCFDPVLVMRAAVQDDRKVAAERETTYAPARVIRRRGSLQQGRALEMLGHAVEYLIDSRMFDLKEQTREPEAEAVQILMKLSRSVFNECPEVIPMRTRVARLLRLAR